MALFFQPRDHIITVLAVLLPALGLLDGIFSPFANTNVGARFI